MSLRTLLLLTLVAVVALSVLSASIVSIATLDRRAEAVERDMLEAFTDVSDAIARRAGLPEGDPDTQLPGVLRPDEAVRRGNRGAALAIIAGGAGGGLLGLGFGLLLLRTIRRPLERLETGARGIAAGRLEERVEPTGPPELRRLAESFNAMAAGIERTDGERRAWLDDLAHELRTPLSVIQAYSEALADGLVRSPEERREGQRAVAANAAHCTALLEALRGELGGEAHEGRTRVADLFAGVEARFEHAARHAGKRLEVVAPAEAEVQGHPVLLGRALDRLVENALQAGTSVRLSCRVEDAAAVLVVDDDGPGIAPEDRVRAFDRFWRGDAARSSRGSGLGLSIVRDVARRVGGAAAISESPLGGARLELSVPVLHS
jgi:signal transduction histidine kinase